MGFDYEPDDFPVVFSDLFGEQGASDPRDGLGDRAAVARGSMGGSVGRAIVRGTLGGILRR